MNTFYLTLTCRNCDEEIVHGPCMTFIEHEGLPVIPFDLAAQQVFHCEACRASNYTGDFEMLVEGGS